LLSKLLFQDTLKSKWYSLSLSFLLPLSPSSLFSFLSFLLPLFSPSSLFSFLSFLPPPFLLPLFSPLILLFLFIYTLFLQLPPSGSSLAPGNGRVTQVLRIINSEQGKKPILLKVKVDYVINNAPVNEIADVAFPPTL
jgi:Adaptin C-terminal domain